MYILYIPRGSRRHILVILQPLINGHARLYFERTKPLSRRREHIDIATCTCTSVEVDIRTCRCIHLHTNTRLNGIQRVFEVNLTARVKCFDLCSSQFSLKKVTTHIWKVTAVWRCNFVCQESSSKIGLKQMSTQCRNNDRRLPQ